MLVLVWGTFRYLHKHIIATWLSSPILKTTFKQRDHKNFTVIKTLLSLIICTYILLLNFGVFLGRWVHTAELLRVYSWWCPGVCMQYRGMNFGHMLGKYLIVSTIAPALTCDFYSIFLMFNLVAFIIFNLPLEDFQGFLVLWISVYWSQLHVLYPLIFPTALEEGI